MRVTVVAGLFSIGVALLTTVGPAVTHFLTRALTDDPYLDVIVLDGGPSAIFDVRIVNPASTALFVRELELQIDSTAPLGAGCCPVAPTSTYHLSLAGPRRLPLAHLIPGDGAERFRIQVIQPGKGFGVAVVYGHLLVTTGQATALLSGSFGFRISTASPGERLDFGREPPEPTYDEGWRNIRTDPFPSR